MEKPKDGKLYQRTDGHGKPIRFPHLSFSYSHAIVWGEQMYLFNYDHNKWEKTVRFRAPILRWEEIPWDWDIYADLVESQLLGKIEVRIVGSEGGIR